MKITANQNTLHIEGAIKSGMEWDFDEAMDDILLNYPEGVIVNMTKVPFINSAALGIMLNKSKPLKGNMDRVKFVINKDGDIHHLIQITKLESVLSYDLV